MTDPDCPGCAEKLDAYAGVAPAHRESARIVVWLFLALLVAGACAALACVVGAWLR